MDQENMLYWSASNRHANLDSYIPNKSAECEGQTGLSPSATIHLNEARAMWKVLIWLEGGE